MKKATGKNSNSGRITKGKLGYSLPIDKPLFPSFPYLYKKVTMVTFGYETDRDAALSLLPSQFELPQGPTIARMIFASFEHSSLGPYNEVAQAIPCTYEFKDGKRKGEKLECFYPTRFHVTTDCAMAAGREIIGIPKKLGNISFHNGAEYLSTLEKTDGTLVCSASVTKDAKISEKYSSTSNYASIRVIPNCELSDAGKPLPPSICQLIESEWVLHSGELWSATGNVYLNGDAVQDPYYKLPILNDRKSKRNPVPFGVFIGEMNISKVSLLENF